MRIETNNSFIMLKASTGKVLIDNKTGDIIGSIVYLPIGSDITTIKEVKKIKNG